MIRYCDFDLAYNYYDFGTASPNHYGEVNQNYYVGEAKGNDLP